MFSKGPAFSRSWPRGCSSALILINVLIRAWFRRLTDPGFWLFLNKKIPPGRTAGRINRGQCHDRMKLFYHARKVPAMVESWLFRSRCSGLPAGIPPGKDQNRFRPPVREEYRPPGCVVQDKKESPRRADGGRIERGNDGEESFFGNDPSRLEGSGRIKGGAMKAQGNYSIFKASLQSGGGLIRLVFLPVQGPGLFAVSAVGSLWFIVVHRGSNYPGEGSAGCWYILRRSRKENRCGGVCLYKDLSPVPGQRPGRGFERGYSPGKIISLSDGLRKLKNSGRIISEKDSGGGFGLVPGCVRFGSARVPVWFRVGSRVSAGLIPSGCGLSGSWLSLVRHGSGFRRP